ncbi:heme exporter protein CcmD [Elongatibacter sediminis]|uniref:Heme exporter protein D n=1 Tax=Elongatibacter sediminis TaxID=3119006 RepID=A0AAW9RLU9_9GAMM
MNHQPFIWSAYAISAIVLIWTALAPVLRRRRTIDYLKQVNRTDPTHDTHA